MVAVLMAASVSDPPRATVWGLSVWMVVGNTPTQFSCRGLSGESVVIDKNLVQPWEDFPITNHTDALQLQQTAPDRPWRKVDFSLGTTYASTWAVKCVEWVGRKALTLVPHSRKSGKFSMRVVKVSYFRFVHSLRWWVQFLSGLET